MTEMRTTENILAARKVVDMADQIAMLDPKEAPLVTLLKKIKGRGTRVVANSKFDWLEDDLIAATTEVVTPISSGSTTSLVVKDGSIFRAGDILNVPSVGENMLVSSVSTNTLTVVRGYGSTAAAEEITAKAVVVNIGNAQLEGANLRQPKWKDETNCYNYTQIFRTPISLSGTEEQVKLYGGNDRPYQRRKALLEHKRDISYAMYFGQRKLDTSGGIRRTMGGLSEFIGAGNTTAFSAGSKHLTLANFDNFVAKEVFRHGSTEKLMMCGPNMLMAINSWDVGKLMTKVGEDATFGVGVTKLITSFGVLDLVYDPLLANGYSDVAFIIDPANVRYVYLRGRDTRLLPDRQANDADAVVDEYLTECSLEVKLPATHHMITGAYVQ